jgi:hypothetical protein
MSGRLSHSRSLATLIKVSVTCAGLALAGCSSGPAVPPPEAANPNTPDTCGAGQYQSVLGKLLDVVLLQNITDSVASHRVLVMRPDTVATTDSVPERIIIKTDKASMIQSISCG